MYTIVYKHTLHSTQQLYTDMVYELVLYDIVHVSMLLCVCVC